ncbi:hypothetical protein ABC766_27320 [Methylobacterium fujisawaense]|uniref:hypothetical protein n=1 Tax=Methylobacterium fujisawaense TaxID=107400 RepID=UPI0031F5B4B1
MAIRGSSLASAIVPLGGPAGLPGQSTYAAWLALGNSGTLADFVAAQKGAPGITQDISAKSSRGHTTVADTNYQILTTDVDVGFTSITVPHIVKLCDVDAYPLGQDLVIGDESGTCSATNTITILVGDGTSDTIPQQSDGTIVLAYPYASVRLRRGAANIWKIV